MKRRSLWRLSVTTAEPAADAVGELLARRFGQAAAIYTDALSGQTIVTIYPEKKPEWSWAARHDLSVALRQLQCSSKPIATIVKLGKLPREDWAESWKRHFKPLRIGSRLLIRPSWTRPASRAGQVTVVLDPGLSFGTGQHPTTSFCLRELLRARKPGLNQSFLDVGTGSGILAICAAKLGYSRVHALDYDSDAIKVARSNARSNGVSGSVRFQRQDLAELPLLQKPLGNAAARDVQARGRLPSRPGVLGGIPYSVVCANLISNLLLAEKRRLLSLVQSGGVLVLAGILEVEFGAVQRAYEAAGMRLIRSQAKGEWRSGSFGAAG